MPLEDKVTGVLSKVDNIIAAGKRAAEGPPYSKEQELLKATVERLAQLRRIAGDAFPAMIQKFHDDIKADHADALDRLAKARDRLAAAEARAAAAKAAPPPPPPAPAAPEVPPVPAPPLDPGLGARLRTELLASLGVAADPTLRVGRGKDIWEDFAGPNGGTTG